MANLGVRKESKEKKHATSIKSLPKELQVEIFAMVASRSVYDHCMVKLCCKEFLDAAEDDYVYRHVSMEKFALVPLPWFIGEKECCFLKRCKESGHPEIAFREGMVQYFSRSNVEWGLEMLKKAAVEGHREARYVHCMLLMCGEDEGERIQGFDLFCSLRASTTSIKTCRQRVKGFVRSLWVNNKPVVQNPNSSFCRSSTCDIEKLKKLRGRWSSFEDQDFDSTAISCRCCGVDSELSFFYNIIGL